MGYPDDGYILPGLNIEVTFGQRGDRARGATVPTDLGGVGGRALRCGAPR